MVEFKEAYKIAKSLKENIDNCSEYTNAYVFGFSRDDEYCGGYGHTPVVILKENGKSVNMPWYMTSMDGEFIRDIEICEELALQ